MSRLNDLLRQVGLNNEALAADLQREVAALADRRSFGLNFERHVPEAVELPGRPIRRGDKVRCLPERGQLPTKDNEKLYRVTSIYTEDGERWSDIVALDDPKDEWSVLVSELVVVAEFRDPIYPGLISTGRVARGGEKPCHAVINAENFHALQALMFTHRGKVDCIYIDPPYNTGAKDWKYNNDYVEGEDLYRHSKWLAFMERRLLLAKELLNPDCSVLIVTIDEKEYLRLGMLLEQTFPEARIQMVSSLINPKGQPRASEFTRVDEYIFFVMHGTGPSRTPLPEGMAAGKSTVATLGVRWQKLRREGTGEAATRQARPGLFYPIFLDSTESRVMGVGEALPLDQSPDQVRPPDPSWSVVWPIRPSDGGHGRWQTTPANLRGLVERGYVKVGTGRGTATTIYYLQNSDRKKIDAGLVTIAGLDSRDGSVIIDASDYRHLASPPTQWRVGSHDAGEHGGKMIANLIGRRFPFPKSLYAVEDCLRFFVAEKRDAVILDFFAGSGTTAHAVMRLNKQDGGLRRSISVTNNEVSAEEQIGLRQEGLRPGDPDWEARGICDYITKPRIEAAITGRTPTGEAIPGAYRFTDEFPMAQGFEENVEFFRLTYEAPLRVASHRDFLRIAPLLWLRAGSRGERIDDVAKGWSVAQAYGVLADLDQVDVFVKAVREQPALGLAFIITDEDRLFESVARELPDHVEPVRLYEAYLRNFEIESGRGSR